MSQRVSVETWSVDEWLPAGVAAQRNKVALKQADMDRFTHKWSPSPHCGTLGPCFHLSGLHSVCPPSVPDTPVSSVLTMAERGGLNMVFLLNTNLQSISSRPSLRASCSGIRVKSGSGLSHAHTRGSGRRGARLVTTF